MKHKGIAGFCRNKGERLHCSYCKRALLYIALAAVSCGFDYVQAQATCGRASWPMHAQLPMQQSVQRWRWGYQIKANKHDRIYASRSFAGSMAVL
jgi:hypothetical protein